MKKDTSIGKNVLYWAVKKVENKVLHGNETFSDLENQKGERKGRKYAKER